MENRWSQRSSINLSVMIHYGPIGLISAKATDISQHGMFIETGRIILGGDEVIELSFQLPDGEDRRPIRLSANIVHTNSRGSGVQFLNFQLNPRPDSITSRLAAFSR